MRKALSFVLVLSLVLGSFSMAFAANTSSGLTDVDGHANLDAIQVCYDLGIVTGNPDGTFQPEKAVNRAEFAAMITRALAIPDSALAGYTSTTFKDTVGYGWAVPYLAFCQSKGIMLGDGAGNAMPGRTITVNEAVTMALRAIGYTQNSALLVGAWPANYVSIAQNEDLYDKVASDTTVNKASAAQIIYNLLTVQKVAVNADGDTEFLWKDRANTVPANLLNTNLGAEEKPDVILGDDFGFSDSLINIVGKLGAFGTAYVNDDDELIAFTVKSTALTGKVDGTKFKVGDTKYDIESKTTDAPIFLNGDVVSDSGINVLTAPGISAAAAAYAEDGETVTINVDLSGKKIKEVYSVVAWAVDQDELAPSDVQDDIADGVLLTEKFAKDDDDNIDLKSFMLVGVDSLEDIEEDDVVYVYVNSSDNKIRKVAVGKETVEGVIEEIDDDDSVVVIDGKEYKFSPTPNAAQITDFSVGDEGVFYLDYEGKIFDFDGTSGKADNYAVVKAYGAPDNFNNAKVKLYLPDDSTKTLYYADDIDDIDWVTTTAAGVQTSTNTAITAGALIGYSLDADGDIKTIDLTAIASTNVEFQSTKVMKVNSVAKNVDANAVVFTYDTTTSAVSSYDVAALKEVKKGSISTSTLPAIVIYNEDGKVAAMFIEERFVEVDDDDVYGVFNRVTRVKSGDEDVYRLVGLIDGVEFSKKTDDDSNGSGTDPDGYAYVAFNQLVGKFGVYKITVDANDRITKVVALNNVTDPLGSEKSGIVLAADVITGLGSSNTVITTASGKYTVDDDAVVYKYDPDDKEYTVSKLSALRKNYTVSLYDTKGSDADGIATVVIYMED